ncbi:toprim domain-containing protein [Enterococcus sp. ALS3]|uniref:Toprim domain-containing protein n=1 Tax=Enterococcus alishanensis TaxID=1303817 RepID=A0ABS6THL3_9ENTE|nr:toprim domain-containing protein [Enterococcus alishanensis]MBV7392383.1 toprim domain-containing protein [Enterococcus alishanensis]
MEKIDFYNIPVADYLLSIGEPLINVGHNYYQHKDHDSLKINVRKNYFIWNSRSGEKNASGGVVQYLQIMYGLTLQESLNKVAHDIEGKELKKVAKKVYPKYFNYQVKETFVPLEAQRYLVASRKIANSVIRKFFHLGLITQNEGKEIIFKWYCGSQIVGFSKQGTVKLTQEEKDKYHTKKDYFKYVAPTTEKDSLWGFNYLEGLPKNLYFFESEIDLLSYYTLFKNDLEEQENFWLISINGVALQKIFNFLKYGIEKMDLKNNCQTLNICFDNDTAGKKAMEELKKINFNEIEFESKLPPSEKDWNEFLIRERTKK